MEKNKYIHVMTRDARAAFLHFNLIFDAANAFRSYIGLFNDD